MVYPISKRIIPPTILLWARKIRGKENIPRNEIFIVASNHGSFYDDLAIPSIIVLYLNKYLHMYCNDKFYKNFFLRKFLEWGRCIPIRVDEKSKEAKKINEKAFENALKLIKNKEHIGIFPEGHRNIEGKLRKAKTGIAKLALKARVPVLPIGIYGSYKILPKGAKFLKLKRCEINIGKPLCFKKYYGKENNKKVLNLVTKKIMKTIAKLIKQEYNY